MVEKERAIFVTDCFTESQSYENMILAPDTILQVEESVFMLSDVKIAKLTDKSEYHLTPVTVAQPYDCVSIRCLPTFRGEYQLMYSTQSEYRFEIERGTTIICQNDMTPEHVNEFSRPYCVRISNDDTIYITDISTSCIFMHQTESEEL